MRDLWDKRPFKFDQHLFMSSLPTAAGPHVPPLLHRICKRLLYCDRFLTRRAFCGITSGIVLWSLFCDIVTRP
jgi:hypothetical protein